MNENNYTIQFDMAEKLIQSLNFHIGISQKEISGINCG
jgi:hypothetical protein